MPERRPAFRKRVLWTGKGVYANGDQSFACTIRDWTEQGARIAVRGTPIIPARFFLLNLTTRTVHNASVMWSDGRELGLQFLSTCSFENMDAAGLSFLKRHLS